MRRQCEKSNTGIQFLVEDYLFIFLVKLRKSRKDKKAAKRDYNLKIKAKNIYECSLPI
jgi:hypothetical protein